MVSGLLQSYFYMAMTNDIAKAENGSTDGADKWICDHVQEDR